jgi:hypothetical protein
MAPQRLNIFQRLQRHWDELHPYNAAQILQLRGRGDPSHLTESLHGTLHDLKLGAISVAGRMFVHEECLAPPEVKSVTGQSLDDHISAEMNRPFDRDRGCPFRPFVLQAGDSHFAGIVYHHWVADSASIRLLMHEWFRRIYRVDFPRTTPVPAPEGGYWKYFGPSQAKWDLLRSALHGVSWQSRIKKVRRIESPDFREFRIRFSRHALPDGIIDPLRTAARMGKATINDLFLAEIARLCDRHVPVQLNRKRHDLALGTIVDLRSQSRSNLGDAFGLFLGFSNIVLRPQEIADSTLLLHAIARQSRWGKINREPEASMLRMLAGVASIRLLGGNREKVTNFFRKRMPLAGGISNVNLNQDWPVKYHPDPLEAYIRVSPTGPMMPLVFTPTTLGRTLHFGLSYREAIIPEPRAQQIAREFADALKQAACHP